MENRGKSMKFNVLRKPLLERDVGWQQRQPALRDPGRLHHIAQQGSRAFALARPGRSLASKPVGTSAFGRGTPAALAEDSPLHL